MSNEKSKFELYLEAICKQKGLNLEKEYKFDDKRKYRFDYAIIHKIMYYSGLINIKIAFEYEGGIYMNKSGHTNTKGYYSNCNKYNLAAYQNWKVYRFTAAHFNKSNINETLDFIDKILTLEV
jgi:hypothetical protein